MKTEYEEHMDKALWELIEAYDRIVYPAFPEKNKALIEKISSIMDEVGKLSNVVPEE